MLSKTVEFLRIADLQPPDEKVRKRQESVTSLLPSITGKENKATLLDFLQGVVVGFAPPLFVADGPAVTQIVGAIQAHDATLSGDLTENGVELRAAAAIAVGELLAKQASKPSEDTILAASAIISALEPRPATSNKHLRVVLETLFTASVKLLTTAADQRRQTGKVALQKLQALKKPEGEEVWDTMVPVIRAAISEVSSREEVAREEIETLWWMFSGFSEIEQKSLSDLSPVAAGACAGIELAQRALVPPSPAAAAMVKRSVEAGRKSQALGAISLQDVVKEWPPAMIVGLLPKEGNASQIAARYPSILPLSFACRTIREAGGTPKLDKIFATRTGIPLNRSLTPAEWGVQVLREKILQRMLSALKEV